MNNKYCRSCWHSFDTFDNKKIKKQNICLTCYIKQNKPYNLQVSIVMKMFVVA